MFSHTSSITPRTRRKERHFSQSELASRSGVSFASYKRFEQKHEISFDSLIKIAIALDMEKDFDVLFATPQFSSIEELIASEKKESSKMRK
ncbi:MAG: helix-turn-helix transcriptional regulator [Treponema sp.]|nr:helix-turn-helix transcriptional regulator [Treponema sp.]